MVFYIAYAGRKLCSMQTEKHIPTAEIEGKPGTIGNLCFGKVRGKSTNIWLYFQHFNRVPLLPQASITPVHIFLQPIYEVNFQLFTGPKYAPVL